MNLKKYEKCVWESLNYNGGDSLMRDLGNGDLQLMRFSDLQLISDAPKLVTRLVEMETLLKKCQEQFANYAQHHFKKKTLESIPKYELNLSMSNKIKSLLEKPI